MQAPINNQVVREGGRKVRERPLFVLCEDMVQIFNVFRVNT